LGRFEIPQRSSNEVCYSFRSNTGGYWAVKRRDFIAMLGGAAAAWPLAARGQQPRKVWRIGFIAGASRPASLEVSQFGGFQQGMREHGYVEGKGFVMEWCFADVTFFTFLPTELC
jgi:putative ABC transport system substrate-binding protein